MKAKKFIKAPVSLLLIILVIGFVFDVVPMVPKAVATQTAGGVNWLDTNSYQKPKFIPINEPSTTSNVYWVDLGSGSGTTCSQSSPCGIGNVLGKPGTVGGPAIIHIKGTGGWSWFNDNIHGSGDADCRVSACDNWILITTWPAGSTGCAIECTATITGNSNLNSTNVHHLIFDGGPDLKIRFNADSSSGIYGMHIMSDYTIIYRTQGFCTSPGEVIFSVGDNNNAGDHTYFINNEGYGCMQSGAVQAEYVYLGPGSGTVGGADDLILQNNILRDFGGEAIEINPRITVNGVQIIGNAIYNGGNISTFGGSNRPCVVVGNNAGNNDNGVVVANNLIWNCGSGGIWARASGTPAALYYNNTIYDYNNKNDQIQPQGISSLSGACPLGIVRNNIIYDPQGTNPTCAGGSGDHNLCASGKNCGTSSQVYNANVFASLLPTSNLYLTLASGSVAIDTGTATGAPPIYSSDYIGLTRPQGITPDIGAFEFLTGGTPPPGPPPPPPPPTPTVTISANPTTINSGSSSTITWSSTDATSCSASGSWSGTQATFGSTSVSPSSTSTYTLTCTGTGGSANGSATVTVNTVTPPGCTTSVVGTWQNVPFTSQNATFTASFDVTPNSTGLNALTGLSFGNAADYTNLATIVRFFTNNLIDARNGGAYAAATSIPYTPGSTYHIRMTVNVTNRTYSIFVTPPSSSEITLGTNYSFRTEQNTITSLNNLVVYSDAGTHNVCNFSVSSAATPVVGDINLDHIVNAIDYSILNSKWFTTDSSSDLNHDGLVNAIDYSILNANWFKTW